MVRSCSVRQPTDPQPRNRRGWEHPRYKIQTDPLLKVRSPLDGFGFGQGHKERRPGRFLEDFACRRLLKMAIAGEGRE